MNRSLPILALACCTLMPGMVAAAPPTDPATVTDATEFDLAAGAILSTGNSRSFASTGVTNFRLRRGIHQAIANFAGNYGMAAVRPRTPFEPTVGNVQGRARYDVFVHPHVSVFGMVTARHDRFQGLEVRMNVDPGVAAYALIDPKHRLWFEAGYDLQYDVRSNEAILAKNAAGLIVLTDGEASRSLDKTFLNHAARLFAGYANNLHEKITFTTGLEYLQSVIAAERIRVNFDVGLSTQIVQNFSLSVTFTLRYDNAPLPQIQTLDTVSALTLVYRLPAKPAPATVP